MRKGWLRAVVFVLGMISTLKAESVITLRFGTPFGPDHTFSQIDQKWFAKIRKDSKGKLEFKPYWGGTLITGASTVDQLAAGVVDVAHVAIHMEKVGFDFAKNSILFYYWFDPVEAYEMFKKIKASHSFIDEEYAKMGIKIVAWTSTTRYQLITRKPVRKTEDVKGLRLRVLGPMSEVFGKLGAECVTLPAAEIYEAMSKGIIHGVYLPLESLKSMKLAEVAKYCTILNIGQGPNAARAINLKTYNQLPTEIREVIDQNIDYWTYESINMFKTADDAGIAYGKEQHVEFITFPNEELKKIFLAVDELNRKIVDELEKKGIPAKVVFEEIMRTR